MNDAISCQTLKRLAIFHNRAPGEEYIFDTDSEQGVNDVQDYFENQTSLICNWEMIKIRPVRDARE